MYNPPIYIHPLADAEAGCQIGEGTKVWRFSHIMSGAIIGKNCVISQGCFVAATARIGDGVRIQNNVSIFDGCIIEDEVFLGPSCVLTNVKKPKAGKRGKYEKITIKKGATIGANSTLVCPVTIGEGATIGAGSVVTHDVPANELWWGAPARRQDIRWYAKDRDKDTPNE